MLYKRTCKISDIPTVSLANEDLFLPQPVTTVLMLLKLSPVAMPVMDWDGSILY